MIRQMQQPINILLENAPEALLLLDKDGFVTYTSPAITRITAYTPANLLQQPFSVFYADKDETRVAYELRMAATKGVFISEGWRIKKDDTKYWGEITIAPVIEAGTLQGYSCILRDQTEKKNDELALRSSEERYRLLV